MKTTKLSSIHKCVAAIAIWLLSLALGHAADLRPGLQRHNSPIYLLQLVPQYWQGKDPIRVKILIRAKAQPWNLVEPVLGELALEIIDAGPTRYAYLGHIEAKTFQGRNGYVVVKIPAKYLIPADGQGNLMSAQLYATSDHRTDLEITGFSVDERTFPRQK